MGRRFSEKSNLKQIDADQDRARDDPDLEGDHQGLPKIRKANSVHAQPTGEYSMSSEKKNPSAQRPMLIRRPKR
jgi:hypothetical protein